MILDSLSTTCSTNQPTNQCNQPLRDTDIETDTPLIRDEPQPETSEIQRWDKIRGNRASKFGKIAVGNLANSGSPKNLIKRRPGEKKVVRIRNNRVEREKDIGKSSNEVKASKSGNQSGFDTFGAAACPSSSSLSTVKNNVRPELAVRTASPIESPFTSYITAEYVTPVGMSEVEWGGLQMALKGSALNIMRADLAALLAGSAGDASETAVG